MFLRALLAFLLLPGIVAFAVPLTWVLAVSHSRFQRPLGFLPLIAGVLGLLWCVRDFYVAGRGTLAPWEPPRRLVIVGLYRFSRNPMYVAVVLILLGWAWVFGAPDLLGYAVIVAIASHLRVVLGEEPTLRQAFGEAWEDYARRVPRWLW